MQLCIDTDIASNTAKLWNLVTDTKGCVLQVQLLKNLLRSFFRVDQIRQENKPSTAPVTAICLNKRKKIKIFPKTKYSRPPAILKPIGYLESPAISKPAGYLESPGISKPVRYLESPVILKPVGYLESPAISKPLGDLESPGISKPAGYLESSGILKPADDLELKPLPLSLSCTVISYWLTQSSLSQTMFCFRCVLGRVSKPMITLLNTLKLYIMPVFSLQTFTSFLARLCKLDKIHGNQ